MKLKYWQTSLLLFLWKVIPLNINGNSWSNSHTTNKIWIDKKYQDMTNMYKNKAFDDVD